MSKQPIPQIDPEDFEDSLGPKVVTWASDEQKEAFETAPGGPLLLIGGYNSGKSSVAILKMLAFADAFPGYRVAVLRKTFKDLEQTTRPTFNSWVDRKRIIQESAEQITLDNGSTFLFHHLDSPKTATIIAGLEINGAILDQAEQMQERTFTTLFGRLGRWKGTKVPKWVLDGFDGQWPWLDRQGNVVPPAHIILTANPAEDGDPETHWLWRRFDHDSKDWIEKWKTRNYRQIIFDTRHNQFATQQNVDILMEQDDDYIERYVKGRWVRSKGHIFRIDPMSILEPDPALIAKIKNTMPLARSLDHGDSAPTCCLWHGVDADGNIFVWQEYYQAGTNKAGKEFNISDHRRTITRMSQHSDGTPISIRNNLADPSIFSKTRNVTGFSSRSQRWSISDEYTDKTLIHENTAILWQSADNGEEITRSRLKEHLKIDRRHKHPITGERGAPHLYFIKKTEDYPWGCDRVLSETRAQKRKQVGESDGQPIYSDDRDPTVVDHAYDALKYFVVSHPMPAQIPEEYVPEMEFDKEKPGRVLINIPPITSIPTKKTGPKRWRSRGGGY